MKPMEGNNVIPAEAGIHERMDPRIREDDKFYD